MPKPSIALPAVRARDAWHRVRYAALFYLVLLAEVVGFAVMDPGESAVDFYLVSDLVMLVTVVAFALPIGREILGLFRVPRMDAVAWALLLLGPAGLWFINQGLLSVTRDLPGVLESNPILDLRADGAPSWMIFLIVCVHPPLVEEAAFRGVILEKIREALDARAALVVVSVLFSVLHLAMLSFLPFAALAFVLGQLRLRTGSLWPAIAGHALFNIATMFFGTHVA